MILAEFFHNQGVDILESQTKNGEILLNVKVEDLLKVAELLKNDRTLAYDMLLSVIGVDAVGHFEARYSFYSTKYNKTLLLKTATSHEKPQLPSFCGLYDAANWHERECFDLFGIEFVNHPNLKRILLPDDWLGFPLRKDYSVDDDERLVWNKR